MCYALTKNLLSVIFLIAFATMANATSYLPPVSFNLSKSDQKTLAEIACRLPYGLKMDRAIGSKWANEISGIARCATHAFIAKQPVHYQVTCIQKETAWDCWNRLEYLRGRIGRRELLLIAPRELMKDAYGATKYLMENKEFQPQSYSDDFSLSPRSVMRVHAEPAGTNTLKIQSHLKWIYVEAVQGTNGTRYHEVEGSEHK